MLRQSVTAVSIFLALLFLVLAIPLPGVASSLPRGVIKIEPARKAPALRLANSDGVVTDLRDLRGRWVMVHFWASWCTPCRKELPTVQRMAKQLVPKTIELVKEDDVTSFLFGVAPDLDTLMDSNGVVTNLWQPRGLPSSFFVDPDGMMRYVALGGRPWDTKPYLAFIRSLASR